MTNEKWKMRNGKSITHELCVVFTSLLRPKVPLPRSHRRILNPAHFNFDLTKAAIASFVRWIVAQAVLSAYLVGHCGKRCARLLQIVGGESFSSRSAGHL